MKVLFSTHTQQRIMEQGIDRYQLIKDVEKMPPIKTKIRWFLKNGTLQL